LFCWTGKGRESNPTNASANVLADASVNSWPTAANSRRTVSRRFGHFLTLYGDTAKLLFTDTDSLTYEIETEDVYEDFQKNKDKFDNSNYPQNSKFYDETNKKVIGTFKDKAAGALIKEFIGLRSKMYSSMKDNDDNSKTAKGIK